MNPDVVTGAGRAAVVDEGVALQARSFYRAIPLYLAVPVAIGWVYGAAGVALDWRLVGWGALGWWIALLLRAPVALVAKGRPPERAKLLMVGASGPLEEGVRLGAVLLLAPSLAGALSLGLGWASIEVAFAVVNGLVVTRILRGDDEKARAARELLESQGTIGGAAPWLGVVERVFASALHIGFTLVLAAVPALVLATAPFHSGVNLLAVRLLPSLGRIIGMLALAGLAVLALGLLLMARAS